METHQYSFQKIRQMLVELAISQKETDLKFQATDLKIQKTDK